MPVQSNKYPRQPWLVITEVCQAWKQVALAIPSLWTRLVVYSLKGDGVFKSLLARSGGENIHLVLHFIVLSREARDAYRKSLHDGFREHGARIASLTVKIDSWDAKPLEEVIAAHTFPALRLFSLVAFPDNPIHVTLPCNSLGNNVTIDLDSVYLVLYDSDSDKIVRRIRFLNKAVSPREDIIRQIYGLGFLRTLEQYAFLTEICFEYSAPRMMRNTPLCDVHLPPGLKRLSIIEEPWGAQSLLSHLVFHPLSCTTLEFLALNIDLRDDRFHYSSCVLEDTLRSFKWDLIYQFVADCSSVRFALWPSYAFMMTAGHDSSLLFPKWVFGFKNGRKAVIKDIATNLVQNYFTIFSPPYVRIGAFSKLTQFWLHDASGTLGQRLEWGSLLRGLPASVHSLALGDASLVCDFINAMQDLAEAVPPDSDRAWPKKEPVRFKQLSCCVIDSILSPEPMEMVTRVLLRCRQRNLLEVDELILRLPAPPPLQYVPGTDALGVSEESYKVSVHRHTCSICHGPSPAPR